MGITTSLEQRKYAVTAPVMASIYLLIKVHKKNFPGRAVVSQIDDPTYKLCKVLTDILRPLDKNGASYIENSFQLKQTLEKTEIRGNYRMYSLDVVALYPSIPIRQTLEIVKRELEADKELSLRTDWKVEDIMKLLEIAMETYFKTKDGRIYLQTDGTPIGKSISGPLAGIFMNWFEKTYVFNNPRFKPVLWKRMRDDVFILWDQGDQEFDCFYWYLLGINPKIQFTLEKEVNKRLPFLDMDIRRDDTRLITKVYRKPTHTQQYIHWRSNHPKKLASWSVERLNS
jgi:hypothetical protein